MFIQDADGACTLAADKVSKGAKKMRCLWHLWKSVEEKLGSILGKDSAVSTRYCVCADETDSNGDVCVVRVTNRVMSLCAW